MTLNILRPSQINPKLSAYNQVWGNFDFNKTPLAPPGCKVVVHESADKRDSFGYHGKEGFYYGWSPNHYRNVNCWIKETGGMRDLATVNSSKSTYTCQKPRLKTDSQQF